MTKISRRDLFKDVGAMGAATILSPLGKTQSGQSGSQQSEFDRIISQSSKSLLQEHENYLIEVTSGEMVVAFDKRYGSIASITRKGDEFGTNYIGNEINTPGVDPSDSRFTGDVVTTVWELLGDFRNARLGQNDIFKMSGRWRRELTSKSSDIRRIG